MMFVKKIALSLIIILLASCSGMSINTDSIDKKALKTYESFAWRYPYVQQDTLHEGMSGKLDRFLQADVTQLMIEKGYQQEPKEKSALLVTYRFARDVPSSFGAGLESGGSGILDGQNINLRNRPNIAASSAGKAYLVLEFTDAKNNEVVWRSTLKKSVEFDSPDDERLKKVVGKAVEKMLRSYPKFN